MKTFFKKLLTMLLALITSFSCFACAGGGGDEYDPTDPTTLDVYLWSSGNGKEYMEAILNAFKAKNPDVNINFTPSSSVEGADMYQDADNATTDIYFTTMSNYMAHKEYFEPLNGVLDMEVDGTTVGAKLGADTITGVTASDNNIYALPWSNSVTGFVYNATVFEQKGFEIPKTTNQLIDLCGDIASEELTPFIQYAEYWNYPLLAWMAQYAGVSEFNKYWKGVYTDNGVEKVNDISLFRDNVAKKVALEVLPDLLSPQGYTVVGTNNLSHTTAQTKFLDGQAVMTPSGSWMENEMKNSTAKGTFKMMKYPVISALGTKLGITEDQLVALVAYVDGDADATQTAYAEGAGVQHVERVREARNIVYSEKLQFHAIIPKNSPAKETAKKFLAFYYSDEALAIAESVSGMILPATYSNGTTRKNPQNDTAFVKSCSDIVELKGKTVERNYGVPIFYNTDIQMFWYKDAVRMFTYISGGGKVYTYDEYMTEENNYWNSEWNNIIADAGI